MRIYRFTKERLFSGLSKSLHTSTSTITNNSEKLNAIQVVNLTLKVDDINNKLSTMNESIILNNNILFFNCVLWNSVYFPVLIFCSN